MIKKKPTKKKLTKKKPIIKRPEGKPRNPKAITPEVLWDNFKLYMNECNEGAFQTVTDTHSKPHVIKDHNKIPTLNAFCRYIGYAGDDSLRDLVERHPEYLLISNRIRKELQDFLIRAGIADKVNGRFVQFVLNVGYGLVPRTEQTVKAEVKSEVKVTNKEELKQLSDAELAKRLSDRLINK